MAKTIFSRKKSIYPEFSSFHIEKFWFDGREYNTGEGAFQSMKVLDKSKRSEFTKLTGGQAKKLGRQIPLRSDWESVKFEYMVEVVYSKFSSNERLKKLLLSTGRSWICEDTTSWHDNVWGCCYCSRCSKKSSKNMLGFALMFARAKLRGEEAIVSVVIDGKEFDAPLKELYDFIKTGDERGLNLINVLNRNEC